jgi:hypothetical protein
MSSRGRTLVGVLVPVALLLIASPAADLVAALLPMRPGEVSWRFGAYGLITNSLITPILGLAIILVVSEHLEWTRSMTVTAAVCAVLALILFAGFALFVLDYIQLRQAVGRAARGPYDAAAFKAMLVAALEAGVLLAMSLAAFRARTIDASLGHRRRERVGLVVQVGEDEGR